MKLFKGRFKDIQNQLLVVSIANICSINIGFQTGWLSPLIITLRSPNSPLSTGPITTNDQSWIGASVLMGVFIAPFLFTRIADRFGRKVAIILIPVPTIIGTFFLIFEKSVLYFIIFRIFSGLSFGATFVLIPMMVTEISDDDIRGTFGSILVILQYCGLLIGIITTTYASFESAPYYSLIFPVLLIGSFILIPESPVYLYSIKKEEKAKKSLIFYKNCGNNNQKFEMERAKIDLMLEKLDAKKQNRISSKDIFTIPAIRGFLTGIIITILSVCTGVVVLAAYSGVIFNDSGSTLDPNESSMIIAVIQIIGALVGSTLCDRIGRKILLIVSLTGCAIGQFTMGMFVYCGLIGYDISSWSWTSVVSMSLIFFAASIGIAPLRHVVCLEVVQPKVRSLASILNNTALCLGQFSLYKFFPTISEAYGLHTMMWTLCTGCLFGVLFCILVIRETKGKNVNT